MTRDEILEAIKSTARDNGGRPLGRDRFERTTGITDYDWGKHWARFTDAQVEAGFEPNRMNAAYDHEHLMVLMVGLIRELGKFPTYGEMRVQRSRDPAFPSRNVYARYGDKNDLVGAVLAFVRERPEYADVVSICEASPAVTVEPPEPEDGAADYGFVYLVKGRRGEYKIGRASVVDRRLVALGTSSPVPLVLVHEIRTDDPVGVEAYWHRRFASKRMSGEWFRLDASDVRAFKRWKRIH